MNKNMTARITKFAAGCSALALIAAVAGSGVALRAGGQTAAAAKKPAAFSAEEIDRLTAPIALYPDQLLAQILICAQDPAKVRELNAWLKKNTTLKGTQLQDAAVKAAFEPSFVALVLFPDIVNMMAVQQDWTTRLGQAFTADRSAVFSSIQRLRAQAQKVGNLKDTPQQEVETKTTNAGEQVIVIEPANPQVVYVPKYNATTVYTAPQTVVVEQQSSSSDAVVAGIIGFTAGIAIGAAIDNDYYYGPYGWRGGAYMYNDAWDDYYDHREDAREDWADHREDLSEERTDRRENTSEQRTDRVESRQENRPDATQAQKDQARTAAQERKTTKSNPRRPNGQHRATINHAAAAPGPQPTPNAAARSPTRSRGTRAATRRGRPARAGRAAGAVAAAAAAAADAERSTVMKKRTIASTLIASGARSDGAPARHPNRRGRSSRCSGRPRRRCGAGGGGESSRRRAVVGDFRPRQQGARRHLGSGDGAAESRDLHRGIRRSTGAWWMRNRPGRHSSSATRSGRSRCRWSRTGTAGDSTPPRARRKCSPGGSDGTNWQPSVSAPPTWRRSAATREMVTTESQPGYTHRASPATPAKRTDCSGRR